MLGIELSVDVVFSSGGTVRGMSELIEGRYEQTD
jgi:hypothetical protein